MSKTVVHVTTIEEWNSVLKVWFNQGKTWVNGGAEYSEDIFENGGRYLFLGDYITWSNDYHYSSPSKDVTKNTKPLIPIDILYI